MLDALAQVLVCAALFLALRWGLHRVDALGRPGRFPAIAVVALVLPALVFATPGVHRRAEQKQLAAAASELIGIRVSVHCQTFGQAFVDGGTELGYVKWGAGGVPEHRTLIKHDQCADLRGYLHSSKVHPTLDQVIAVHVLTHESMHHRRGARRVRGGAARRPHGPAARRDSRRGPVPGTDVLAGRLPGHARRVRLRRVSPRWLARRAPA